MPWAPDYLTVAELKAYLDIGDTVDDALLAVWCTAASRAADDVCNRQFGKVAAPVARVYRRRPVYDHTNCLWLVDIDDVQDTTGMTIAGTAYASSGATLLPDNAPGNGAPWERLGFMYCPTMPLTVVASWGWTAVPAAVTAAVRLQANRWNARRRSPFGVAGSPENGNELRLLARRDPDFMTVLRGLARRKRVG